jgi:hypothetical protein
MSKDLIWVKRSVEGGKYEFVVFEKELAEAFSKFDSANNSLTFILFNGIAGVENDVVKKLGSIVDECSSTFRKYQLNKYDVRANYKWNESLYEVKDLKGFSVKKQLKKIMRNCEKVGFPLTDICDVNADIMTNLGFSLSGDYWFGNRVVIHKDNAFNSINKKFCKVKLLETI